MSTCGNPSHDDEDTPTVYAVPISVSMGTCGEHLMLDFGPMSVAAADKLIDMMGDERFRAAIRDQIESSVIAARAKRN